MKIKKTIISVISIALILLTYLLSNKIFAEEKLRIIDMDSYGSNHGILYSDNRLYAWYKGGGENIIENIKKFYVKDSFNYLTYDHVLTINKPLAGYADATRENVDDFKTMETSSYRYLIYKTVENKLYRYSKYGDTLITSDIKDFDIYGDAQYGRVLFTTSDNALYAYGTNVYGSKVNNGEKFTEPYKLSESVTQYAENYYLTESGDLIFFNSSLYRPETIATNIKKVIANTSTWTSTLNTTYKFYLETKDDANIYINFRISSNAIVDKKEQTLQLKPKEVGTGGNFILTNNGEVYVNTLYTEKDNNDVDYTLVDDNVKEMYAVESGIHYLKNDNILYVYNHENKDSSRFIYSLTHNEKVKGITKLLTNVKTIKFMSDNNNSIILEDESLLRYGDNIYDRFKNTSISSSFVPVKVDELINNYADIVTQQIVLGTDGNTTLVEGENVDYFATVVPYNAKNKGVTWESSDPNIVTVDNTGYVTGIKEGSSTICARSNDNQNIKSCTKVTVAKGPSSIEILEGEDIYLSKVFLGSEFTFITASIVAENGSKEYEYEWTKDEGVDMYDYYLENNQRVYLPNNKKYVSLNTAGTHTITVKYGNLSKTIRLHMAEKTTGINFNINSNNYDGVATAYIYTNESNTLQLGYTVTPSTAVEKGVKWSSSDTSVATIDANGLVTAKKPGRVTITAAAKDGGAQKRLSLIVYGEKTGNISGDFNGDGEVNILDLIKFRNYLAGNEETLY